MTFFEDPAELVLCVGILLFIGTFVLMDSKEPRAAITMVVLIVLTIFLANLVGCPI